VVGRCDFDAGTYQLCVGIPGGEVVVQGPHPVLAGTRGRLRLLRRR